LDRPFSFKRPANGTFLAGLAVNAAPELVDVGGDHHRRARALAPIGRQHGSLQVAGAPAAFPESWRGWCSPVGAPLPTELFLRRNA